MGVCGSKLTARVVFFGQCLRNAQRTGPVLCYPADGPQVWALALPNVGLKRNGAAVPAACRFESSRPPPLFSQIRSRRRAGRIKAAGPTAGPERRVFPCIKWFIRSPTSVRAAFSGLSLTRTMTIRPATNDWFLSLFAKAPERSARATRNFFADYYYTFTTAVSRHGQTNAAQGFIWNY